MADLRSREDAMLERLFPGDSELAGRMRALDWSRTDVGLPEDWPENLRIAVSLCLGSRFPIVIYWGSEFVTLYNDAYAPILASKHPQALGKSCHEVWAEIWDVIEPMLKSVVATGEATWSDDQLLILRRHGYPEECYFSFSFSPIRSEGGGVAGVFTAVIEHTQRVVGERRLEILRKLGAQAAEARTVEAACGEAAQVLEENPHDIPFAAIYLVEETGAQARFCASAGFAEGAYPLPSSVSLADSGPSLWPLASVLRTRRAEEIPERDLLAAPIRGRLYPEPVRQALVLPIPAATQDRLAGLLVVGVSPRRILDGAYRTFYALVAGHVGTAITDATAYETERKRAEALAELDRAKTAFFSNVSHELRTPLTLMLGPTEDLLAMRHGILPLGACQQLAVVLRNALRGTGHPALHITAFLNRITVPSWSPGRRVSRACVK